MNFLEALKSGKRFRPTSSNNKWIHVNDDFMWVEDHEGMKYYMHLQTVNWILGDFEVEGPKTEEPTVTITKAQLAEAWNEYIKLLLSHNFPVPRASGFEQMCKKLGL